MRASMEASKEEHEAFLQQERQERFVEHKSILRRIWPYFRLLVEVVMIMCIFVLSTNLSPPMITSNSLRKTPIPQREIFPSYIFKALADRPCSAEEVVHIQRG